MSVERLIESAEEDIVRRVQELRAQLDKVEAAITDGMRVPAGVSGDPFFTSAARDLEQACIRRQAYYDASSGVVNTMAGSNDHADYDRKSREQA